MPRRISRRYTTAVLVAAVALTVCLAPRVGLIAPAEAATSEVRFDFSAASYRVSEGDGDATITVVRIGDPSHKASVKYLASELEIEAEGCIYGDILGSATPGVDYARTSGTLLFAPGETSRTFRVPITDDAEIESRQPESVFVSLDFSPEGPTSGSVCYGAARTCAVVHEGAAGVVRGRSARIVFASNRDGHQAGYEIYAMNADGTGQTRLTNNQAQDSLPTWQPQTAASAPVLLNKTKTIWAIALDSVTQVADPFAKSSSSNFSTDRRTRVSLFATGVTSPSVADITAAAEDSAGRRHELPVEHVATVPGLNSMIQVIVRLPDGLDGLEYVWVGLTVRGTPTNQAIINIQKKP